MYTCAVRFFSASLDRLWGREYEQTLQAHQDQENTNDFIAIILCSFLVTTGLTKTIVWYSSLDVRFSNSCGPGLDWTGTSARRLDHTLGELEPSGNSSVFLAWLPHSNPSLHVQIKGE